MQEARRNPPARGFRRRAYALAAGLLVLLIGRCAYDRLKGPLPPGSTTKAGPTATPRVEAIRPPRAVPAPQSESRRPATRPRRVAAVRPAPASRGTRAVVRPQPARPPAPAPSPALAPQPAAPLAEVPSPPVQATPAPVPEAVSSPTPAEPEPQQVAIPTPEPLPEPLSEAPPAPRLRWPALEIPPLVFATTLGWVDEIFGPESVSFTGSGILALGIEWEPGWQDWRFPVAIGQTGFQFTSTDYPGMLHRRAVTSASVGAKYTYGLSVFEMATGIGLGGRWASVTSTSGPPAQPAPSTMWFSPKLNLAGFTLLQDVVFEARPDLAFGLKVAFAPAEFADVLLTDRMPGSLIRLRVAPEVALGPGGLVRLGLFYDRTMGGDPTRAADGSSGEFVQTSAGASVAFGLGALSWPAGGR